MYKINRKGGLGSKNRSLGQTPGLNLDKYFNASIVNRPFLAIKSGLKICFKSLRQVYWVYLQLSVERIKKIVDGSRHFYRCCKSEKKYQIKIQKSSRLESCDPIQQLLIANKITLIIFKFVLEVWLPKQMLKIKTNSQ